LFSILCSRLVRVRTLDSRDALVTADRFEPWRWRRSSAAWFRRARRARRRAGSAIGEQLGLAAPRSPRSRDGCAPPPSRQVHPRTTRSTHTASSGRGDTCDGSHVARDPFRWSPRASIVAGEVERPKRRMAFQALRLASEYERPDGARTTCPRSRGRVICVPHDVVRSTTSGVVTAGAGPPCATASHDALAARRVLRRELVDAGFGQDDGPFFPAPLARERFRACASSGRFGFTCCVNADVAETHGQDQVAKLIHDLERTLKHEMSTRTEPCRRAACGWWLDRGARPDFVPATRPGSSPPQSLMSVITSALQAMRYHDPMPRRPDCGRRNARTGTKEATRSPNPTSCQRSLGIVHVFEHDLMRSPTKSTKTKRRHT